MAKIQLIKLAHGRSGDKGNTANIGIVVRDERDYGVLEQYVTAEVVAHHLAPLGIGEVKRFELPNIGALNFLVSDALAGGGTASLRSDSQGKTLAAAVLRLELDISTKTTLHGLTN